MNVLKRGAKAGTALLLSASLACSSSSSSPSSRHPEVIGNADLVRYRLRLRHNPVDPSAAFRCYGSCQSQRSPESYLQCLTECPGFEITPGAWCGKHEVPPEAACFTARKVPNTPEVDPGVIVVAVIANVALVIGLASLCASSSSQCGYPYTLPPPR